MTHLSSFDTETASLLISLPYKVGMWVSHADDVDGESDDESEQKALEQCIASIAKLHEDQPFVKEVAAATLEQKEQWSLWADQSFNTPSDVQKAVQALSEQATETVRKNYNAMLMEIASTVAQAASEYSSFEDDEGEEKGFGAFLGKITSALSGMSEEDPGHPMNISAAEDETLAKLAAILKNEDT